jgi:hypothetical protein
MSRRGRHNTDSDPLGDLLEQLFSTPLPTYAHTSQYDTGPYRQSTDQYYYETGNRNVGTDEPQVPMVKTTRHDYPHICYRDETTPLSWLTD